MSNAFSLNPHTLSVLRESRALSQTALAAKAGVTQPFVCQLEKGIRTPKHPLVLRLAESLDCSPSLLGISLPRRDLPVSLFRKKSRTRVRDEKATRARAVLYQYRIRQILDRCPPRKEPFAVGARIDRDAPVRTAARQLRTTWGIPPGPIDNVTELVESHGVLVVPAPLVPGVDALSVRDPQQTIPPMVFMAPNVPGDRWRLSLTHELAHLVLEHHRDIFSPPQALEDEAFEFAREFLCPIREIGGHLRQLDMYRLAQLKKYWKVSMASMLLTAQKTGRISRHEAQWLWVKLRRGGKSEPVRIPEEHPQLIRTLVKQYLQATGDSFAGLSRRLHYRRPDEFREDFGLSRLRAI